MSEHTFKPAFLGLCTTKEFNQINVINAAEKAMLRTGEGKLDLLIVQRLASACQKHPFRVDSLSLVWQAAFARGVAFPHGVTTLPTDFSQHRSAGDLPIGISGLWNNGRSTHITVGPVVALSGRLT